MSASGDSPPLAYFLAGVLVPTLAYVLFVRSGSETKSSNSDDDDDDSSDDEFGADMSESPASSWGMKDAPYKVISIAIMERNCPSLAVFVYFLLLLCLS
mmetsp:Transcript_8320/g.16926  ORF Transcript_8320/g.16926 Transcript_8320/m.16926 type:complete len:99 (-) Transcript_8320:209-505(-)